MQRLRYIVVVLLLGAVGALGLAVGCAETGSLPSAPEEHQEETWKRVFPALTSANLYTVWGMDADDMWAGGDYGSLLHWDGRRSRLVDIPTDDSIRSITGLASDAVWALADGDIFRWDGRRWQLETTVPMYTRDICVLAPDDIYAGGGVAPDSCEIPRIMHYDGRDWTDMEVPYLCERLVEIIWRPSFDHPVMASTGEHLLRLRDGAWEIAADGLVIRDVDGAIGIDGWPFVYNSRFFEITRSGEIVFPCGEAGIPSSRAVVDSRTPLFVNSGTLRSLNDCSSRPVASGFRRTPGDLAVPERPGSGGSTVFGVGGAGLFIRCVWQPDGGMEWADLAPGFTARLEWVLDGDAEHLFANDGRNLIVGRDGQWHGERMEAGFHDFRAIGGGRVQLSSSSHLQIREADGSVTDLPSPPNYMGSIWCDGENGWGVDGYNQLCRLADGAWSVAADIEQGVAWLDARHADEVYILTGDRLLRFDGTELHDLTPESNPSLRQAYLGPVTGRIFVRGFGDEYEPLVAVLENGVWTSIGGDYHYWADYRIIEITRDLVLIAEGPQILKLTADGWQLFEELDSYISDIWGSPDRGLYILTQEGNILHRDLTEVLQ